jgi:hypothetical protein
MAQPGVSPQPEETPLIEEEARPGAIINRRLTWCGAAAAAR